MIPSPSSSVKIQVMARKVCLKCKSKTLVGIVNKLFVFKSLLPTPSNVLPLHPKHTFVLLIWIFTEDEGDGIKSRLPFKIYSTLPMCNKQIEKNVKINKSISRAAYTYGRKPSLLGVHVLIWFKEIKPFRLQQYCCTPSFRR